MTAPPFAFIVGSGRSGTTLARTILDAHPRLAIPDETHFVTRLARHRRRYEADAFDARTLLKELQAYHQFERLGLPAKRVTAALGEAGDYPDAIRRLYALYADERGKDRYGDKTPRYCLDMPMLALLFPEARFVHVIRDGRDVALSVREMSFGPDHIGGAALYWRNRALTARRTGEWLPAGTYTEYRHEELVAEPEPIVRELCSFLDLSFDPAMLRYHERAEPSAHEHHPHVHEAPQTGLRDWRNELTPEELRLVEILVADALDELGYERVTDGGTLDTDAEQRLQKEAKRIRRAHNDWEAKAFGFVNVPSRRPRETRAWFRRSWMRERRYSPPVPDEG